MKHLFSAAVLCVAVIAAAAAELPLENWSAGAEIRNSPVPGNPPALYLKRAGAFHSPETGVKPSTRYLLKLRSYGDRANSFYLELDEYAADGRKLPRTDWKRHRDTFLRPDKSLRREELEMELPFDTQPESVRLSVRIEKLNDADIFFRDFRIEEEKERPLLAPDEFREPDALSLRGPDGILYPDFSRAGVSERQRPSKLFAARDFGAVPGDAEDDTAGIQRAVDAAAAAGGGIVQLEPGEYRLSGKIHITADRTVIRGAGREATRLIHLPHPSRFHIMNTAPGDRIGANTRLELYFPWKGNRFAVLSHGEREIARRELPEQAKPERFSSDEEYLKFLNLRKTTGFAVSQHDPETGKIVLEPKEFLAVLPPGTCTLTLKTIGWDGKIRSQAFTFTVTPKEHYTASHAVFHFQGREYNAATSLMPLAADVKRGDTRLELASDHRLDGAQFLFLSAPLGTQWDRDAHTPLAWGKMRRSAFRIAARDGKKITLGRPSRVPFFAGEGSYASAFHPIRFCSIEDLSLEQRDALQKEFKLHAVAFQNAADCEARGLEIIKAGVWPVQFSNVLNCTFSDSVLRGAWLPRTLLSYAGFENGTDCLLERLETFDLRHAPLLNWSCSGCVVRDSTFRNSDAQLHSGYCLENLFEQCRVIETTGEFSSYGFAFYSTPFNDGMHGSNGPRNVIYNCDMSSRRSSIYLGGNNSRWRIVYNRFHARSGPGIIARLNCRDNIVAGNLFVLDSPEFPLFFNEYLDNTGNTFTGNTVAGGNGGLWGGVRSEYRSEKNRFLPAGSAPPEIKAPVPSLYLWQKEAQK
ncbi:MAG: right-handed parallel beta-helix repeat-containing protein [Lentisphaeria bacterium]|nr:right-handed parallel beta-helix repeat-containing protein [Lentisphaeria bacterium]